MSRVGDFLRERLPVRGEELRELTNEPVPNHLKHWWFCLGGTPLYLFVVMVATGILLAFYYEASPETAWQSVKFITEQAAYGWFLRSLHRWAATLMVAAVVLHQMRVFFTQAESFSRSRKTSPSWPGPMPGGPSAGSPHCSVGDMAAHKIGRASCRERV